jgi:hypothetical protein
VDYHHPICHSKALATKPGKKFLYFASHNHVIANAISLNKQIINHRICQELALQPILMQLATEKQQKMNDTKLCH